jgi:hypothetical protein
MSLRAENDEYSFPNAMDSPLQIRRIGALYKHDHTRSFAYCSRVNFNQTDPLPMLIPCSMA